MIRLILTLAVSCIALSTPSVHADENEIVITPEQWKEAAETPAPGRSWQHVATEGRVAEPVKKDTPSTGTEGKAAASSGKAPTITDINGKTTPDSIEDMHAVGGVRYPRDIKKMWDAFRTGLSNGDVDSAVKYISPDTREPYRRDLEILKNY